MTAQHGDDVIKCYINRELSEKLKEGDRVSLTVGKHTVF